MQRVYILHVCISVRLASLWRVKVCEEVSLNLPRCKLATRRGRRQQTARRAKLLGQSQVQKWQACYTYSINQHPHTLPLTLPFFPPLYLSASFASCRLSIIEGHRRTSKISFWFLLASPFGIVFAFVQTCSYLQLQHAACGVFMACHKRLSKLHKAIKVKSQITVRHSKLLLC